MCTLKVQLPWLQVANVNWVNLRKQDSKASPSLAQLYAGQKVELLVDACGSEDGWVRVLYHCGATGSKEEYDGIIREEMTGYIWHSFLEPVQ
ncbi:MAG: SH3 domain-containing protein [Clostridia bacterium]|nr:SH3 domain-containing protein [Clostridia bacterium]